MTTYYTRSAQTDSYEICSLAKSSTGISNVEGIIVSDLVKGGISVADITNNNTTYGIQKFTGTTNAIDLLSSYTKLPDDLVNTSSVSAYPPGLVTTNSALLLTKVDPTPVQEYSVGLGNREAGNTETNISDFDYLVSSSSIHDSTIVATTSYLPASYDSGISNMANTVPSNANYRCTFDTTNENHRAHIALNSRWNTRLGDNTDGTYSSLSIVGDDTITISENFDFFNEDSSLGMEGTTATTYTSKYASLNSSDGSIQFTDIDTVFQPALNHLVVEDRTVFTGFNETNDVGIFRFQQDTTNSITTSCQSVNAGVTTVITGDIPNIPIMNATAVNSILPGTGKNELPVPGQVSDTQFQSLYNADVFNTISDLYEFKVEMTTNDGGYSITEASHPLISSLDDSNIKDNAYYMENYVRNGHSISFSNSTLSITAVGGANTDNISLIDIDCIAGETLLNDFAGVNGNIKLLTNTETTRTANSTFSNMGTTSSNHIKINYDNISETMKTRPYLFVQYDKVALKSSNEESENVFKSSNGAFLTMYNDGVVNSSVDGANVGFTFNNNTITAGDNFLYLWRITSDAVLVSEPESFFSSINDTTNVGITAVNGISVRAVMSNFDGNNLDYNYYRNYITAKELSDISLSSAVTNSNKSNWTISYSVGEDSYLKSSSSAAFSTSQRLPAYSPSLIENMSSSWQLYYKYTFSTEGSSSVHGALSDGVVITYSSNSNYTNSTSVVIPQSDIVRTYSAVPADNVLTVVDVLDSTYTLTSPHYSSENWKLVRCTKQSKFNASFDPLFTVFSNIRVKVENNIQTNVYYALQSRTTQFFAPHSALEYVGNVPSGNIDFKEVTETITYAGANEGNEISGILTEGDFKPFTFTVQAKKDAGEWSALPRTTTGVSDYDVYYATDSIYSFTVDAYIGSVTVNSEFHPFSTLLSQNQEVNLTDSDYYTPFIFNPNDSYHSVSSFTCSVAEIGNKTSLVSDPSKYLTVEDNYSSTNSVSWSSSNYSINVSDNTINDTTTFNVKDTNGNIVFYITRPSAKIHLGTQIVTYIPVDCWRSTINLGVSSTNKTTDTIFATTPYTSNSNITFTNTPGITVEQQAINYQSGASVSFRVLSDSVAVNLVGTASDAPVELTASNLLEYQYVSQTNASNFSGIIKLAKYRGYKGTGTQNYTIVRPSATITFRVSGTSPLTDISQIVSSKMYYNQNVFVNNLRNGAATTCADLNIGITSLFSLPPTGSTLSYGVTVRGDSVAVTISNPNYIGNNTNIVVPNGSTPLATPTSYSYVTTLLAYGQNDIYTFSGANYNGTGKFVSFRPSRVTLRNTNLPYDHAVLIYKKALRPMTIYRAKGVTNSIPYLGNPALIGTNDAAIDANTTLWEFVTEMSGDTGKQTGYSIGRKTFKLSSILAEKHAISYYVSVPPQLRIGCVSSYGNTQTPYNLANLPAERKAVRYFPYKKSVTPFKPFQSTTVTNILGTNTTISYNNNLVNNMTFELLQPRDMIDVAKTPAANKSIIVAGTNLKLELYSGLNSERQQAHQAYTQFDAPITSMSSVLDIAARKTIFRKRDVNGSITFSVAQLPNLLGYSDALSGYEDIYKTTNQSIFYNLDFNIGNVTWQKSGTTLYFDNIANGNRATLYTVTDVNDPSSLLNKRRVYKYSSSSPIRIDRGLSNLETLTLQFNAARQYVDVPIIRNTFGTTATSISSYSSLLSNTTIESPIITWTSDPNYDQTLRINYTFNNEVTAAKMPQRLFGIQDDEYKWTQVLYKPFISFTNQMGNKVSELSWDGTFYAPLLNTQIVSLHPGLAAPTLNDSRYSQEQYSVSSLTGYQDVFTPTA